MKKLLLIPLLSMIGIAFVSCDKIKDSLAGTRWEYSDGSTIIFYEKAVASISGDRGTYDYAYPEVFIHWAKYGVYNEEYFQKGEISGKTLTIEDTVYRLVK